jgi:hypothetical protein
MTFCAVIPRHVCGPSIYGRGALAREVVPLVDAGNAAELRSLARKQLVHEDAVEAKPRQGRNAGSAEIVQTPGKDRCGLRAGPARVVSARLFDRRVGSALGPAPSRAYTETQPETPLQKPQICWLDIPQGDYT